MNRKPKKMTAKEKAARAQVKRELQEAGIIPPDKPKLNRKKYVEDAVQEWNSKDENYYAWDIYLFDAISIMLGQVDSKLRVSPEAVGVAKCLKLAIRLKEFQDKLKAEGRKEYTLDEQYRFIEDIVNA